METSPHPQPRLSRWLRLCLVAALFSCSALSVAGNALADDPAPVGTGQEAATGQGATANGVATQTQPINIVITVRIDSPGNDGPISQSNVTVGSADAGNGSATTQTGGDGTDAGQQAASGQDASATGDSTQSQPINIVVSVRVNSPGNDGPISQTNVDVSGAGAGNTSATTQETGSGGSENALKTASPRSQGLRHSAAPAEAADDVKTATAGRRSAPRRGARTPAHTRGHAAKSLGRPISGAAAAHPAGPPAAVARALPAKRAQSSRAGSAGAIHRAAARVLRRLEPALPASPRVDSPGAGVGLVQLTAIALLGALLLWALSTWLGTTRRPVRIGRGRWR